MRKYYEIWPLDDWSVEHACQLTGISLKEVGSDIIEKYKAGIMVRDSDGPFYMRNLLNQALRDQDFYIRIGLYSRKEQASL